LYILLLIIGIVSISGGDICAQINPGARQIALCNSDAGLCNDVFAIYTNPAGTAQLTTRQAGIYYSPAPFGLKELANGYIAYNEPFSWGAIDAGVMVYGFDLYKETKMTAAVSYKFRDFLYLGAAFNLHLLSIQNYGHSSAFYANFGSLLFITQSLRWGFSISNLNNATFSDEQNQIPVILNTGLCYNALEGLNLCAALEKDLSYKPSFKAGIEYRIIEYLTLRTGFANNPSKYSAGVGISFKGVQLDYAFFTHPYLGLTHQAGLLVNLAADE
jgi:long-subunit fatty acid transport protein